MSKVELISGGVEEAFRKIEAERMQGVPILNPRLHVEAVGERAWNGHRLAVLITPWFINLMLFPATEEQQQAWGTLALGASVPHSFPAGRFDFLVGEEQGLGRYLMCSLFSPVLEFESHEAAQITAHAALEAIFDADLDKPTENEKSAASEALRPEAAPSRRGLLTGKIGREGEPA